mmetsp:Transcript_6553/g.16702  ORF Transcript_6553/g.16702 Transcript_6553/m.16702 type:complete len:104 (-) Transcript_6553:158-469(-)
MLRAQVFKGDELICSVEGRGPTAADAAVAQAAREAAAADQFSFSYTGRHDHGELPAPRAVPALATLLFSLEQARDEVAAALAPLVPPARDAASQRKTKKPRTD